MRKPDFLVIGAQKAASTYIQFCLSDHPEIWMPHGETPYFEDPDYVRLGADYLNLQVARHPARRVGFKRPQWIGRAEVPARICKDLPDAQLIAVLRNPVDRAVSAYYHYMRGGYLPVLDPEIGLAQLLDVDQDFAAAWPRSWEVLEFGLYHKHLSGYTSYFDRGKINLVLQEDVIRDPVGTARGLYTFLGVDTSFTPVRTASRPQAVVYNLRRLRLLQVAGRLTMCKNADNTRSIGRRGPVAMASYRAWRAIDENLLERMSPSLKPRLSQALQVRLWAHYCDDIDRLAKLTGRDLSGWQGC